MRAMRVAKMTGTDLCAKAYKYPWRGEPRCHFPPIFTFFLAPPGSSHISGEPPRGNLTAGNLLHQSLSHDLASSSSSDEVLEVISSIPLAAMEPEIVSSLHAVDAKEEDSLLKKSGGLPSHHDMVDQHLEDYTLEA
jgi:hypothetical protein